MNYIKDSIKKIIKSFIPSKTRSYIKSQFYKLIGDPTSIDFIKKKISKRDPLVPLVVYTECTNYCNSKCITCPRDEMTRKKGFMSLELYKKIIDECVEIGVPQIRLHNFGEVTLDKNLVEKIRIAKKSGIKCVTTYTNGQLLKTELSEKLIDAGIDVLYVSIDGVTKKSYEYIRKGLNYNTVEKNILDFDSIRKKVKNRKIKLYVTMVYLKETEHEKEAFFNKWKKIADGTFVSPAHSWAEQKKIRTPQDIKGNQDNRIPCPLLWNSIYILWDGKVVICCEDFDGKFILGDVTRETLKDIWYGEQFSNAREDHLNKRFENWKICDNCHVIRLNPTLWTLEGDERFV